MNAAAVAWYCTFVSSLEFIALFNAIHALIATRARGWSRYYDMIGGQAWAALDQLHKASL